MKKRNYKKKKFNQTGNKQYSPNPNLPILDAFIIAIQYLRKSGLISFSSIDAYEDRTVGQNGKGLGVILFLASGIKCLGDISMTTLKIVNKYIDDLEKSASGKNAIKTALRQLLFILTELGLAEIPDNWIKVLKLDPTQPPEPVCYSRHEVELILKSKVGRTPFEILRNEIIIALILLRGLRPGKEIYGIKNKDVCPQKCYLDVERKDGVIHRCYVRRDLADKIEKYQRMRGSFLKKSGCKQVEVFFINTKNGEI